MVKGSKIFGRFKESVLKSDGGSDTNAEDAQLLKLIVEQNLLQLWRNYYPVIFKMKSKHLKITLK